MAIVLPQELIAGILFLLPIKSLLRFRCVSKSWFALISDPYFIKMHAETNTERSLILEPYTGDYYLVDFSNEDRFGDSAKIFPRFNRPENLNDISVIGCCNGLVCILSHERSFRIIPNYHYEILIWNPSIRKYKKLPFEPVDDEHEQILRLVVRSCVGLLGFGYDPLNHDYKVLRIVGFGDPVPEYFEGKAYSIVKVYSMKAQSWRRVEDRWPCNWKSNISSGPAFSNGAIHWLVKSIITGASTLVTFDLITEKFGLQTVPFKLQRFTGLQCLQVLGGSLCVSQNTQARAIDVWMMKEYGVASSWSRLCVVPMTVFFSGRPLMFSKDGEKVLMEENCASKVKLFWYDIKNKTRRFVENDPHISNKFCRIKTCGGSLLLLDGDSDN